MIVKIIAAVSKNGVIGDAHSNDIPWKGRYPEDFKFFRQMTSGGAVIFGRKTFESIGKPLPKRANIVITRQEKIEGAYCYDSLDTWYRRMSLVLEDAMTTKWICGGANIYREAMLLEGCNNMPVVSEIYLTLIPEVVKTDSPVYFPWIDPTRFEPSEIINLENSELKVMKYVSKI